MKTPADADWVAMIAFIIAGLCVAAIAAISIREKWRTGKLPAEIRPQPGSWGWFGAVLWLWLPVRFSIIPAGLVRKFPLFAIVPGIDIALTLALLFFAGFAVSHVFRTEWTWRHGLWVSFCLAFPALGAHLLRMDAKCLAPMPWAWVFAGIVGIVLAPILTRLVFVEFYLSRFAREPDQAEPPRRRIYRPGEPTE